MSGYTSISPKKAAVLLALVLGMLVALPGTPRLWTSTADAPASSTAYSKLKLGLLELMQEYEKKVSGSASALAAETHLPVYGESVRGASIHARRQRGSIHR